MAIISGNTGKYIIGIGLISRAERTTTIIVDIFNTIQYKSPIFT